MSERRQHPPEGDDLAWMSTFSDLLMLMLTFFVLLLTMSSMDSQKMKEMLRPGIEVRVQDTAAKAKIRENIRPSEIVIDSIQQTITKVESAAQDELVDVVRQQSERLITEYDLEDIGWIRRRPDSFEINIQGEIAFEPDKDALSPRARQFLEELAALGRTAKLNLLVQTYVDEGTEVLERDRGWELALRRADRIARFMRTKSYPARKIQIAGYGYAAGRDERRFLRQSELLSLTFTMPKNDAPERAPVRPVNP